MGVTESGRARAELPGISRGRSATRPRRAFIPFKTSATDADDSQVPANTATSIVPAATQEVHGGDETIRVGGARVSVGGLELSSAGDVVGPVDPLSFGWTSNNARATVGEDRLDLATLEQLPGFNVAVGPYESFVPGPKSGRPSWRGWASGHAPPAAVMSQHGHEHPSGVAVGTLAYFDRLSDALGAVAKRLPAEPGRSPMVVYDFVQGRRIEIVFTPIANPPGEGNVYVVDDGVAFKIGWTMGEPASRIRGLQTGNPRELRCVALVTGVTPKAEGLLHRHFDAMNINLVGEWYERRPILDAVADHGDLASYLDSVLPAGTHTVELRSPLHDAE